MPVPFSAAASGRESNRTFFVSVGGAMVSDPIMWYFPPSALTGSLGSPDASVPIKAVFDSRSTTTVSSLPRFSVLS